MGKNYINPLSWSGKAPTKKEAGEWIPAIDLLENNFKGIITKSTLYRYFHQDKLTKYSKFNKRLYILKSDKQELMDRLTELLK